MSQREKRQYLHVQVPRYLGSHGNLRALSLARWQQHIPTYISVPVPRQSSCFNLRETSGGNPEFEGGG